MEKIITLSEKEYDKLILSRDKIKLEVAEEYYQEVRIPAIWGAIGMLLINGWLYKNILAGYDTFPKLTLITSFFVLVFYILSVVACYSVLKKRLTKN